jgi:transcription antitermination factor NusA-like protein
MKDSGRHVKIVEWSDEDQCFIGSMLSNQTALLKSAFT